MKTQEELYQARGAAITDLTAMDTLMSLYISNKLFGMLNKDFTLGILGNKYVPTIARVNMFLKYFKKEAADSHFKIVKKNLFDLMDFRNKIAHGQLFRNQDGTYDLAEYEDGSVQGMGADSDKFKSMRDVYQATFEIVKEYIPTNLFPEK